MRACTECLSAAARPHHGFRANCRGCCARSLSRSPHFARVKAAGTLDRAYRGMLAQFGLEHASVKAAYEADALNREQA